MWSAIRFPTAARCLRNSSISFAPSFLIQGSRAIEARLVSATIAATRSSRRATSSASSARCASTGAVGFNSSARPMRARISASTRSVLASFPVARANARARRGSTRTSSTPARTRASVSGRSQPPEASSTTSESLAHGTNRAKARFDLASFRLGDVLGFAAGEVKDVDPIPGDIDADDLSWHRHEACPCSAGSAVRAVVPGNCSGLVSVGRRAPGSGTDFGVQGCHEVSSATTNMTGLQETRVQPSGVGSGVGVGGAGCVV